MDDALAVLATEIAAARAVMADVESLDQLERTADPGRRRSARWILVHLIEEYARHLGQADLIRQAIDGATGD